MKHISKPVSEYMEKLGQEAFGRSLTQCWKGGRCISCGEIAAPRIYSERGKREYTISCMCEECFNGLKEGQ